MLLSPLVDAMLQYRLGSMQNGLKKLRLISRMEGASVKGGNKLSLPGLVDARNKQSEWLSPQRDEETHLIPWVLESQTP